MKNPSNLIEQFRKDYPQFNDNLFYSAAAGYFAAMVAILQLDLEYAREKIARLEDRLAAQKAA